MNICVLIGRLTRDPELRYTQSGQAVSTFSIAVDREFVGKDGQKMTDFFNIVVWGKSAENVVNYLAKGKMVAVKGSIQNRSYETQDGQKRYVTEIFSQAIQFLSPAGSGNGQGSTEYNSFESDGYRELQDDDVPF